MNRVTFGTLVLVATVATSSPAFAGAISFTSPAHSTLNTSTLFETSSAPSNSGYAPDVFTGISFGNAATAADPLNTSADATVTPLLEEGVVFTMVIAGGGPASNVGFQYGSDGSAPKLPGGMSAPASIPEPAMLLLLAAGLVAMRRRISKQNAR